MSNTNIWATWAPRSTVFSTGWTWQGIVFPRQTWAAAGYSSNTADWNNGVHYRVGVWGSATEKVPNPNDFEFSFSRCLLNIIRLARMASASSYTTNSELFNAQELVFSLAEAASARLGRLGDIIACTIVGAKGNEQVCLNASPENSSVWYHTPLVHRELKLLSGLVVRKIHLHTTSPWKQTWKLCVRLRKKY